MGRAGLARRRYGSRAASTEEMALARKLVDGLRTIEGVKLYCCDSLDNHLSTILMNLEGVDPANVGVMLDVRLQHCDAHRPALRAACTQAARNRGKQTAESGSLWERSTPRRISPRPLRPLRTSHSGHVSISLRTRIGSSKWHSE